MAHTLQDRYSKLVDAKLREELVQRDGVIWNNRFEGDPKAGAVKVPVRDTEVTVNAYDKATGVERTQGATSYLTIAINKDYAVNEVIDGYDAEAVPDNLVADRLDSAGYSMALQINTDSTAELVASGTTFGLTTPLTAETVYDSFVDCAQAMTEAKIPQTRRWALVSPKVKALLRKSNLLTHPTVSGDGVVHTGVISDVAGFTVFEDNTLPDDVEYICGHPDWCARVREWKVPVHLQSLDGSGSYIGASAVQGRAIYAHKVTKAVAVQIKKNA